MKRAAAARVSEVMRGLLAGLLMLLPAGAAETGVKIVEAARKQVGVTLSRALPLSAHRAFPVEVRRRIR